MGEKLNEIEGKGGMVYRITPSHSWGGYGGYPPSQKFLEGGRGGSSKKFGGGGGGPPR